MKNNGKSVFDYASSGFMSTYGLSNYSVTALDENIMEAVYNHKVNTVRCDYTRVISKIKCKMTISPSEFEDHVCKNIPALLGFLSYATNKNISSIFIKAKNATFPTDMLEFIRNNNKSIENEFNICKLEGKVDEKWILREHPLLKVLLQ